MGVAGKIILYFETDEHHENELIEELETNAEKGLFQLSDGKTIRIGIIQLKLKELSKTIGDEEDIILVK